MHTLDARATPEQSKKAIDGVMRFDGNCERRESGRAEAAQQRRANAIAAAAFWSGGGHTEGELMQDFARSLDKVDAIGNL